MPEDLIAYCGVDCSVCPDLTEGKCPGCRQSNWEEEGPCLPVECCRTKGISCCGECDTFPCGDMKAFYQESESHEAAYELMRSMRDPS